jgi:hypothetical protein
MGMQKLISRAKHECGKRKVMGGDTFSREGYLVGEFPAAAGA